MTSEYHFEGAKYAAVINGNTITINDISTFIADWRILKEKAEKWDYLFKDTPDILQNASKCYDKLFAVKDLIPKWREEVQEYPDTVKGIHSRAAVNICRTELEEALK